MPTGDRIPTAPPPDELLLAALERAQRHTGKPDDPGVILATLVDHLGFAHSAWTTRRVRPSLEALQDEGLVERYRKHSATFWRLTAAGRSRLDALRDAGELTDLPESPQHRRWREAHSAASERIAGLRRNLRKEISSARSLLSAADASSEDWFAMSDALNRAGSQLASATYCLREWSEPDDATADIDNDSRRWPRGDMTWR